MEDANGMVDKAGTYLDKLIELLVTWSPKVLLAIVLLIVGIIIGPHVLNLITEELFTASSFFSIDSTSIFL